MTSEYLVRLAADGALAVLGVVTLPVTLQHVLELTDEVTLLAYIAGVGGL